MKQGTGHNVKAGAKVEPKSRAPSLDRVANMGLQVVRTRQPAGAGPGYKAPMAGSSTHKSGSQGRH